MAEQSSMHAYLNWTKQRLDEMDATLASLEVKASAVKAESKVKADQLIAEMKKQRDEFQAKAKVQAQAGEAALQASKAQLETQWRGFETQLAAYFDAIGKHAEQQPTWIHAHDSVPTDFLVTDERATTDLRMDVRR